MPGGYGGVNNFPSTAEDVPSWLQAIGLVRRTPSTRVRAALAGPGEKSRVCDATGRHRCDL